MPISAEKQRAKIVGARRRAKLMRNPNKNHAPGISFKINTDFKFGESPSDGASTSGAPSTVCPAEGAVSLPPSKSEEEQESMQIDCSSNSNEIASSETRSREPRSLVAAACKGDIPRLLEIFKAEQAEALGDPKKQTTLEGQLNYALVQAIASRNVELVSAVLDLGVNMETLCDWYPVSHHVVNTGSEQLLDIFIQKGILTAPTGTSNLLLHQAARIGNTNIVRKLLDLGTIALNAVNDHGQTALHISVAYGKKFISSMLVDAGVDISIADHQGKTVLHEAANRGNDAMVHCLLRQGVDPSICDSKGLTAWFYAVRYGHNSAAEIIAKKTPKEAFFVNNINGKSYLHLAAENAMVSAVKFLLQKGGDPVARDNDGNTPLMCAITGNFALPHVVKEMLQNDAVREHVNATNKSGETALTLAVSKLNHMCHMKETVKHLLKAGADIDYVLPNGETALLVNSMNYSRRDFLVENGANLNFVTSEGKTLLWYACSISSDSEALDKLLFENFDMRLSGCVHKPSGTTPFIQSLLNENYDLARHLIYAGCSFNGLQTWLSTSRGKEMLENDSEISALVALARLSGRMTSPGSLWEQARLATIANLGNGQVADKTRQLGLPPMVECVLDSRNYMKLRRLEYEHLSEQ